MRFRSFLKVVPVATAAGSLMASGCATVFVRSPGAVAPEHVFPATAFDAQMFWETAVKGEPLFALADRDARSGPFARVTFGVGAILDVPFSIGFDTLLLPVDLVRVKRGVDEDEIDGEKGAVESPEK